jgi:hypothetical protein
MKRSRFSKLGRPHLALSTLLAVAAISCGAAPDAADDVATEESAIFNDTAQWTQVWSWSGGLEATNSTGVTARRHGGAFEYFTSWENTDAFTGNANFNGTLMSVSEVSYPKPGIRAKRWACPPHMRGLSGTITVNAGQATGTYRITGDGATCLNACGGQSPAGCWCDASCVTWGDCCADKVAVCGASPTPPKCSCASNCGFNGQSCCLPSQCSGIGF